MNVRIRVVGRGLARRSMVCPAMQRPSVCQGIALTAIAAATPARALAWRVPRPRRVAEVTAVVGRLP